MRAAGHDTATVCPPPEPLLVGTELRMLDAGAAVDLDQKYRQVEVTAENPSCTEATNCVLK